MATDPETTAKRQTGWCLIGMQIGVIGIHLGAPGTFGVSTSFFSFAMGYAAGALWIAGSMLVWRYTDARTTSG